MMAKSGASGRDTVIETRTVEFLFRRSDDFFGDEVVDGFFLH